MTRAARLIWKFALPPVLAVGLLTLVMLGFERRLLGESMLDRSELRARQRAEVLSRQLDVELRDSVNVVRLLARSPLMQPGVPAAAVRAELDSVALNSRKFVWIGLVDPAGTVRAGSRGWLEGQSIARRPVFERGGRGMVGDVHQAVVLAPLLATLPGGVSELIDIGEPVRDASGRLVGVVTAHLGLDWVRSQLEVAIGTPDEAARLGLSAYIVSSNGNRSVVPGQALPAGLPLELPSGVGAWVAPDGRRYVMGRASLTPAAPGSDTLPWRTLVVQTEDAVFEPVNQLGRYMMAVGGLAALLLAGTSIWLSRRMLAPWGELFDVVLSSRSPGDLRLGADVGSRVRRALAGRSGTTPAEQMLGWLADDVDNLRRTVDHLPLGLALIDREFRIEYVNPTYLRMLGGTLEGYRGELAGAALVPPEERQALARIYDLLADPPGAFSMRLDALSAGGDPLPVHWQMVPMTDGEGRWVGGLVVVTDISAERDAIHRAEALAQRLQILADAAIDTLLATLDTDGRVLEWSCGAVALTGIAPERALGRPLGEAFGNARWEADLLARACDQGVAVVQIEDGTRFFEGSIYALRAKGRAPRFGLILRNTAEQRELFRQLQLGEQRLRLALEAAKLATWEIDLNFDPPRVAWTEGYARMLDLPASTRSSDIALADLVHPDDWERFLAALQSCADTDQPLQIDFRIRHRQGWRHHALYGQAVRDEAGHALRLLGAGMDVTDRRQESQALNDSQARFGAIIANASDAIISVNVDGHISLFNPAAERVFGVPASQMLGKPLSRLLPEPARRLHQTMIEGFAHSGVTQRAMGPGRIQGMHADGRLLELEASISQAVSNGQTVLTAILRDVTERATHERLLEAARDELAQLNRRLLDQEKQASRRLARSLQNELGQTLETLRLHWERREADPSGGLGPVPRIEALIELANRQLHDVLSGLRPPLLDELGLAAALDDEVRHRQPAAGEAALRFEASERVRALRWPADIEYAAFMIAREALLNAMRHARASEIVMVLDGDERLLSLSVRDDGIGIEAGAQQGRTGKLGMLGMRERALGLGAHLQVDGDPGHGTIIALRWVCRDAPPAAGRP